MSARVRASPTGEPERTELYGGTAPRPGNLINQYRRDNGKTTLTMHATVTKAAAWFSRDMATRNYFPGNHVDSNGRTVSQRLAWCGVTHSNYAENIFADGPEAQSVFNAWRTSSIHNANLLRDGVTAAGIARTAARRRRGHDHHATAGHGDHDDGPRSGAGSPAWWQQYLASRGY